MQQERQRKQHRPPQHSLPTSPSEEARQPHRHQNFQKQNLQDTPGNDSFDFYDVPGSQETPARHSASGGGRAFSDSLSQSGELSELSVPVLRIVEEGGNRHSEGTGDGMLFDEVQREANLTPYLLAKALDELQLKGFIYKTESGAYTPL